MRYSKRSKLFVLGGGEPESRLLFMRDDLEKDGVIPVQEPILGEIKNVVREQVSIGLPQNQLDAGVI